MTSKGEEIPGGSTVDKVALIATVLAVVIGAGSLSLFAVYLFFGFYRLADLGLGPPLALAWDAALSAVFFLQHSGMVRRPVRARLAGAVGRHLVGVVYTLASGASLLAVLLLWQTVGDPLVSLSGVPYWLARALFVLALAGFAWGIGALGSFDAFGIQPVLAEVRGREPGPPPLVVRGPYLWVRHPLYLFSLVLFWSCPVVTADRLLFNLLWTAWVIVGAILEERDLVAQHGAAYVRYQRQVPMLLPWRLRPARP